MQAGWSVIGQYALSPRVTEAILRPFFTMEYSEWYFFEQVPEQLPTGAFCNWTGLSLTHAHDVAFHHDPEADLSRCRPEFVVGEGRLLYVVYRSCYHEQLLSALPENATMGESQ